MNKSDIKKVYYNGDEITSLYWGGSLIYRKRKPYNPKLLKGKFTDDSTPSDWYFQYNIIYTYLETKEFEYTFSQDLTGTCLVQMFNNNTKLERIDNFPDTSEITSFKRLFYKCTSLTEMDLSYLNTENVTSFEYLFQGCTNLVSLNLSGWKTNKVSTMYNAFYMCPSLETLNISGWDFSLITSDLEYMFVVGDNLTNVIGPISGIKDNIDLGYNPLTNSSAMVFINGLSEVITTKKITFKSTTYNTLSQEQIALATSKGWSVIKY